MHLPGQLDVALAAWLAQAATGGLSDASSALSRAYRAGESSTQVSIQAYLTARLPATFAANARVLSAVNEVWPTFAPRSLLDVGAGPGVATWAAVAQWPGIADVTQVERDARFAECAGRLNADDAHIGLQVAIAADRTNLIVLERAQQLGSRRAQPLPAARGARCGVAGVVHSLRTRWYSVSLAPQFSLR